MSGSCRAQTRGNDPSPHAGNQDALRKERRPHLIDLQQRLEMLLLAALRQEIGDIEAIERPGFETLLDRAELGSEAGRVVELVDEAHSCGVDADLRSPAPRSAASRLTLPSARAFDQRQAVRLQYARWLHPAHGRSRSGPSSRRAAAGPRTPRSIAAPPRSLDTAANRISVPMTFKPGADQLAGHISSSSRSPFSGSMRPANTKRNAVPHVGTIRVGNTGAGCGRKRVGSPSGPSTRSTNRLGQRTRSMTCLPARMPSVIPRMLHELQQRVQLVAADPAAASAGSRTIGDARRVDDFAPAGDEAKPAAAGVGAREVIISKWS